jgi:hypothetical protein
MIMATAILPERRHFWHPMTLVMVEERAWEDNFEERAWKDIFEERAWKDIFEERAQELRFQ